MEDPICYFAYGSNLDITQMKKRCPGCNVIGKAVLKDYRLDFTYYSKSRHCGCADILESLGKEVWGLVFLLTPADLAQLDVYEGHPRHYQRFRVTVRAENGPIQTETYAVARKLPFQKPSNNYLGTIKRATEQFSFPTEYREFLNTVETCD